jgi:hypothetical protein
MRRFRAVFVLLLVVAAGLGSAAAAGAFSAPAATAQLHVDTAQAVRDLPQDHPGSALMRRELGDGDGSMTVTPAPRQPHRVGSGAAGRSALAWWRIGHGSRVLGTALVNVTQLPPSRPQLVWLVSLDLAGGLSNPGGLLTPRLLGQQLAQAEFLNLGG